MEQPFYIGQDVVYECKSTHVNTDVPKLINGNIYIVEGYSPDHPNGIYIRGHRFDVNGNPCAYHVRHFAPIEKAKTKYVVKEVEVATTIRELEICKS